MKKWMLEIVVTFTHYGLFMWGLMVAGIYVLAAYHRLPEILNLLWIYWPCLVGTWKLRKWAKKKIEKLNEIYQPGQ